MAPWCRNLEEVIPNIKCVYGLFYCILISAFFDQSVECKKIHGVNNIRFNILRYLKLSLSL
jgi:hypothetical protein